MWSCYSISTHTPTPHASHTLTHTHTHTHTHTTNMNPTHSITAFTVKPTIQLQNGDFPDCCTSQKKNPSTCQAMQIHIFSYIKSLQSHVMGTSILVLHIDTRETEMTSKCNTATPLTASHQRRSHNLRSRMWLRVCTTAVPYTSSQYGSKTLSAEWPSQTLPSIFFYPGQESSNLALLTSVYLF